MAEDKNGSVSIKVPAKLLWPIVTFALGISGGSLGGFFGGERFVSSDGHVTAEEVRKMIDEEVGCKAILRMIGIPANDE